MDSSVRNAIVYKINVMVLTCFTIKKLLLVFILCICFNFLISLNFSGFIFRNIPSSFLHSKSAVNNRNNFPPVNNTVRIQQITGCVDKPLEPMVLRRGSFWVLCNYVRAEKSHRCSESVTYTTQGDYTFLDNVVPLLQRWKGPISIALHTPGYDFKPTLDSIAYLRNCGSSKTLIKKFVTFHVFFDENHLPMLTSSEAYITPLIHMYEDAYNCSKGPPFENKNYKVLYKSKYNLTYPINVGRNIAKMSAQTHFVLASDIELYPTPNLIENFLKMVVQNKKLFEEEDPKIFVLPVFEVLGHESVPNNKTMLQKMLREKRAFSFHERLCKRCHAVPNATQWVSREESKDLNIFITSKRHGKHYSWEAFYIGTQEDPMFDERLSWEGQSNKMTQGYIMCLLNYDYMVLDNAFLTHKPGVKKEKIQIKMHNPAIAKTNYLIQHQIKNELIAIYGENNNCRIH